MKTDLPSLVKPNHNTHQVFFVVRTKFNVLVFVDWLKQISFIQAVNTLFKGCLVEDITFINEQQLSQLFLRNFRIGFERNPVNPKPLAFINCEREVNNTCRSIRC